MSKVVDYFLKYVAFDTQSAEDAGTVPSTEKQFALAKLLSEQLKNIGVKDVSIRLYPGLRHEILNETAQQETIYKDIGDWLDTKI